MIKKSLKLVVLVMLLLLGETSYPMHNVIFRGAQLISASLCIGKGVKESYDLHKVVESPVERELINGPVVDWAQAEMKRLNVPQIPLMYGPVWAVANGKALLVPFQDAYSLNYKLEYGEEDRIEYEGLLQKRASWQQDIEARKSLNSLSAIFSTIPKHDEDAVSLLNDEINAYKKRLDRSSKTIPLNSFILKHELAHWIHQDGKNRASALALIPVGVQAAASGLSYSFNALRGVRPPQNISRMLLRTSLAAGSVPLKIACASLGGMVYKRQQEKRADEFAYKNAATRLELETACGFFKEELDSGEACLLSDFSGLRSDIGFIKRQVLSMASKRLKKIQLRLNEDGAENKSLVEMQKKMWMCIAFTVAASEHPCPIDRLAMAKSYLKAWDEDRKEA